MILCADSKSARGRGAVIPQALIIMLIRPMYNVTSLTNSLEQDRIDMPLAQCVDPKRTFLRTVDFGTASQSTLKEPTRICGQSGALLV